MTIPRQTSFTRSLGVAVAAALVLLSGCATSYRPGSSEAIVKEKSLARWDALIKGDFVAAYKMTQPAYRALIEADRYKNRFGGAAQWIDAEVVSVECEPERCEVALSVKAYLPTVSAIKEPASTTVRETWIKEEGAWWYYQRF